MARCMFVRCVVCPVPTLPHLARSVRNTQVGGRPLSAVTPEKHVAPSSSGAIVEEESAQLLRDAGDMSPDLTMNSIVEVSFARSALPQQPGGTSWYRVR